MPSFWARSVGAVLRLDGGGQDDHVGFDLHLDADGDVAPHDDDLVPFLVEAGDHAADVDRFFLFDGTPPEFVVALAGGAGVHEEDVGLAVVDLVVVEHGVFGGVHAADLGAVGDPFLPGSCSRRTGQRPPDCGSLPSEGRTILPPVGPEAEASRSKVMPSMTSGILPWPNSP